MKKLKTTEEIIQHLKNKGVTFDKVSEETAKEFLSSNNYFMKLGSYRTNYRKHICKDGVERYSNLDFAYLQELSRIDMHLRYIIFQMCLDIEHYLKVNLLHDIENNPAEDGYIISKKLIGDDIEDSRVYSQIKAHKSSDYCKDLINKYYPDYPVWVLVELISFGDLAHLCDIYNTTYRRNIGNRILLNSVKDLRNASAHSNCLINKLGFKNNRPHISVVNLVKSINSISQTTRDKKLKNKFLYDFTCLMFAYDDIVTSDITKKKRYIELKNLFCNRIVRHSDWFIGNNIISSSYNYLKSVIYFVTN